MRYATSNLITGLVMFVIGGISWEIVWRPTPGNVENPRNRQSYIAEKPRNRQSYIAEKPRNRQSYIAPTENGPRVYVHNGDSLELILGFCRWTPDYDCAEMKTEYGPMPIHIHSVDPKGPYSVSKRLLERGTWEPPITSIFLTELDTYPDSGFIDIGSNIGPFSLLAAKFGRQVLSVDAVIDNMLKLCKSVEKNNFVDRVTMVANPVYNEHTKVSLKSKRKTYEFTQIVKNVTMDKDSVCASGAKSNTVLLDDLLPLINFETAIMKIDVESFEFYVVSGGMKFFTEIHIPTVLMEWQHVKRTDKAIPLLDMMGSLNYMPFAVANMKATKMLNATRYMTWTHDVVWRKTTPGY